MKHSLLPLSIVHYTYDLQGVLVNGFSLLSSDGETEMLYVETDPELEPFSDIALDNYNQTKADAILVKKSVNSFYQMTNLLKKINSWEDESRSTGLDGLSLELAIELKSLLNQLNAVSDTGILREEGYPGEDSSGTDFSTIPGFFGS